MRRWRDRIEAGQELAKALIEYKDKPVIVYGLPRGGVVVAAEVARALNAPLDLIIARKIGHPFHPEYAIGAVTETGQPVLNAAETVSIDKKWLETTIKQEREEAKRRREVYLLGQPAHSAKHKTAILVDDGIATGLTFKAATEELKSKQPAKIVVAVPVAPDDSAAEIEAEVDELVCLLREKYYLGAVGAYYEYFEQTEDNEVIDILSEFNAFDEAQHKQ